MFNKEVGVDLWLLEHTFWPSVGHLRIRQAEGQKTLRRAPAFLAISGCTQVRTTEYLYGVSAFLSTR